MKSSISMIIYLVLFFLIILIDIFTEGKDIKFVFLGLVASIILFLIIETKSQILDKIDNLRHGESKK